MFIGCICNIKWCKKNSTITLRSVDWECHPGNSGAAAVVCREVGLNVPKGNFTIDYLPHRGVLDEGEGLEDVGHVGVEDPVIVDVDLGHGLKICFICKAEINHTTLWIGVWRLSRAQYWEFSIFWDLFSAKFSIQDIRLSWARFWQILMTWCWDLCGSREPIVQPGIGCTVVWKYCTVVHKWTSWSTGGHRGPQGDIVVHRGTSWSRPSLITDSLQEMHNEMQTHNEFPRCLFGCIWRI